MVSQEGFCTDAGLAASFGHSEMILKISETSVTSLACFFQGAKQRGWEHRKDAGTKEVSKHHIDVAGSGLSSEKSTQSPLCWENKIWTLVLAWVY